MHSVLPPSYYHSAVKLYCSFDDGSKEEGSGFILRHGESEFLVSARHVLDPAYRPPSQRSTKKLQCLRILFKYGMKFEGVDGFRIPNFKFASEVINSPVLIVSQDDCDLAAISFHTEYDDVAVTTDGLATNEDIGESFPGEPVCFIGYPSGSPVQSFQGIAVEATPILRAGTLSAFPIGDCEIRDAIGRRYGVIDAFAKRGFSGSPLYLLPRRKVFIGLPQELSSRRGCLVGLIAGHLRSNEDQADGIHSGLAYFTKLTSIRDLLEGLAMK